MTQGEFAMREKLLKAALMVVALLVFPGLVCSQDAPQNLTLIVTGQPGQIPIVQVNGKSYVDVNALARLTNSSLSVKGNQVILTPPGSDPGAPTTSQSSAAAGQLKLVAAKEEPADPEPPAPADQTKPADTEQKPAVESEESKTAALAKAAQNPVADLISFPLPILQALS